MAAGQNPKKMAMAIGVLVLALSLLGVQVFRRLARDDRLAAGPADAGMMMEGDGPVQVASSIEWSRPEGDLLAALDQNPFLRPAGASAERPHSSRRSGGEARVSSARADGFRLSGVRTGPQPTAIINDRIRGIGEPVQGWRVESIERDRVTLRSSDGQRIRLVPR